MKFIIKSMPQKALYIVTKSCYYCDITAEDTWIKAL